MFLRHELSPSRQAFKPLITQHLAYCNVHLGLASRSQALSVESPTKKSESHPTWPRTANSTSAVIITAGCVPPVQRKYYRCTLIVAKYELASFESGATQLRQPQTFWNKLKIAHSHSPVLELLHFQNITLHLGLFKLPIVNWWCITATIQRHIPFYAAYIQDSLQTMGKHKRHHHPVGSVSCIEIRLPHWDFPAWKPSG